MTEQKINILPDYMTALNAVDQFLTLNNRELILPMLRTSVIASPITNIEDLQIKSFSGSTKNFFITVDKILFKHIEFVDEKIRPNTFEEFLNILTSDDKNTMLYGVLSASFDTLDKRSMLCQNCNEEIIFDVKLDEMVHEDTFKNQWNKPVSVIDWRETLDIFGNGQLKITVKYMVESDILKMYEGNSNSKIKKLLEETGKPYSQSELTAATIDKIEIKQANDELLILDNYDSIYNFYTKAPIQLQKKIIEKIDTIELEDTMPVFYQEVQCPKCTTNNTFYMTDLSKDLLNELYKLL